MLKKQSIYILLLFLSFVSFSQEKVDSVYHDTSKYVHFYSYSNPLLLEKDPDIDDVNRKIRKKKNRGFLGIFKKRIFYDYRVKRNFIRSGFGSRVTTENFHTLKKFKLPSSYVKDIYWFDYRKREIIKSRVSKIDSTYGLILHGPYVKKDREENIIEEGSFFIGTKHERWMEYAKSKKYTVKDTIEIDEEQLKVKKNYYKGWPAESEISYYDKQQTKTKEVIPIVYGKKQGEYYKFFKNGWYAETGKYENDKKIGIWTEFWPYGRKTSLRKKEVKYPDDPYDFESQPILQRQWNKSGKLTYELKKEK